MDRQERIEKEISKTLNAFKLAEKLPHNPYFFSRLQARMEDKPKEKMVFATLRPALLASLLIVNIVTAISYFSSNGLVAQIADEQDPYETFASDFNLNQTQTDLFNLD